MRSSAKLLTGLALALSSFLVAAQSNLGDLLDAGAKRLSAEEFRQGVVQRTVVGPTSTGGTIEIMYVANGSIQGLGKPTTSPQLLVSNAYIRGEWTIDESERVCTSMQITGGGALVTILPPRCQVWFKLNNDLFLTDSDSDRRARVYRRTLQP